MLLPVGVSLCLNTAQYAVSRLICVSGCIKEVCLKYLGFNYSVTYCFNQLQCMITLVLLNETLKLGASAQVFFPLTYAFLFSLLEILRDVKWADYDS